MTEQIIEQTEQDTQMSDTQVDFLTQLVQWIISLHNNLSQMIMKESEDFYAVDKKGYNEVVNSLRDTAKNISKDVGLEIQETEQNTEETMDGE